MSLRAPSERRMRPREKRFVLARLVTPTTTGKAHILDGNASGVRVHCACRLTRGDHVVLEVGGVRRRAVVAWSNFPFAGIRFKLIIPAAAGE